MERAAGGSDANAGCIVDGRHANFHDYLLIMEWSSPALRYHISEIGHLLRACSPSEWHVLLSRKDDGLIRFDFVVVGHGMCLACSVQMPATMNVTIENGRWMRRRRGCR